MFLNILVIIIIRFGENNVLGTIFIVIYKFQGWVGVHGSPDIFLFTIHKN